MTRLRASELEQVLAFVADASTVDGPAPFTSELLDRLGAVVPSDAVAFEEVDFSRRALIEKIWSGGTPAPGCLPDGSSAEIPDRHWTNMGASPTAAHRHRTQTFGALKWSDFLGRRHRGEHAVDFGQADVVDQASVWLLPSLVHKVSLVFMSDGRDFTERDRLVLDLLRPHLVALHRAASARRLLAAALAGLEHGNDPDGCGVVLRRGDGTVEFVSARARRLLDDYFGARGGGLPTELDDWIGAGARRSGTPPPPYTADREGRRLVVRSAGRDRATLLVTEEPAPAVPLTAREWDVVRCVAAGSSNAEIARLLWITPGTVRKHLEHVYAKLGVHSRAAAVARLRPLLNGRAPDA